MGEGAVHYWGYVERPIEDVRGLLHESTEELFQDATRTASARTREILSKLRVDVGSIEVGVPVRVRVEQVRDETPMTGLPPVTRVDLRWEAAHAPSLFPLMRADLTAWPISAGETMVELDGNYRPPFGPVGGALDALFGHRVAEAAVQRFHEDVLKEIRRRLTVLTV